MEVTEQSVLQRFAAWCKSLGGIKYAVLAFILGVLILLMPAGKSAETAAPAEISQPQAQVEPTVEERISRILSKMEDAGKVEVMLTVKNDGEVIYQTDAEESRSETVTETRIQTVFSGTSGKDGALVRQKNGPTYLGAVVLAQGGDSADVQYRLKMALSRLTGLSTEKITVLKMKGS